MTKAVITAAGPNQRALPLQRLIDRDGAPRSVLAIIVQEALQAGVEEIGIVVQPGDQEPYAAAAGEHAARLRFIEQPAPLGYGHAVFCARTFAGDAPFLHLVGDHLYVSRSAHGCARQLVAAAEAEDCAISAVQPSRESLLPFFGTVGGRLAPGRNDRYLVERVVEKPTPTEAEQSLIVPGLRVGHYLCFFGMHVLTPAIFELLGELLEQAGPRGLPLAPALDALARRERYLALTVEGRRYDVGAKYGLLNAQLALALEGRDRDEVLAQLVELLALRHA